MKIKSGIYCIMNVKNGKRYIGSSINIPVRWREHKRTLNLGTHVNKYLQHAWDKYGNQNFVFYIVEEINTSSRKELFEYEDKYILEYGTLNTEKGYNLELAGKRTVISENTCRKYRSILTLDKLGNIIKEYISIAEASRDLCIEQKIIDEILNKRVRKNGGIRKSTKGLVFIYKEAYNGENIYSTRGSKKVKVAQLDSNMNIIGTFNSGVEAANKIGVKESKMHFAIWSGGKIGEFFFRRIDAEGKVDLRKNKGRIASKPVIVIKDEQIYEFESTSKAMEYFNIAKSRLKYIKRCIRNGHRVYGNIWKFKE